MATPESITELWTNFKSLVKKVTYDKTEVDNKLSQKANNTLSTVSANGLMSSDDKTKLDGIESGANKTVVDTSISPTSTNPVQNRVINTELASKASTAIATTSKNGLMSAADKTKLNGISTEANKTIVDSALSTTSTNPVQNKVINSEITSLNNNKANKTHTHNDFTGPTNVSCSYGTVKKFKKNGWAFVVYEDINLSSLTLETWTDIADIGWSNQAGNNYTANFQTSIPDDRFRIKADGKLSAMKLGDSNHRGHYGYIIYPTAD